MPESNSYNTKMPTEMQERQMLKCSLFCQSPSTTGPYKFVNVPASSCTDQITLPFQHLLLCVNIALLYPKRKKSYSEQLMMYFYKGKKKIMRTNNLLLNTSLKTKRESGWAAEIPRIQIADRIIFFLKHFHCQIKSRDLL